MYGTKVLLLLGLALCIAKAMADDVPVLGGVTKLQDHSKAEKALNRSLAKLAAGDGPNYKLGKIYSATEQTVAGTAYVIECDLIDSDNKTKKCKVNIWSREWLPNGIEVTFHCDGEAELKRQHSA